MPSATGVKRTKVRRAKKDSPASVPANIKTVKNTRIERPFIIGSEAWPLDDKTRKPDTPADHTKGWRVYVTVPEGQPQITTWLKKVTFKIFHTYDKPTRLIESPPFEIRETGWGGFNVDIRLHFPQESAAKAEYRQHFLQLEPYGDPEQMARQESQKIVRSEFLEIIEFNEPPEAMFALLTSEEQYRSKGQKGKGKGKGKSGTGSDEKGTVELPEVSSEKNPFSRETERQVLDVLERAIASVDEKLVEESEGEKALMERLFWLKAKKDELEAALARGGYADKSVGAGTVPRGAGGGLGATGGNVEAPSEPPKKKRATSINQGGDGSAGDIAETGASSEKEKDAQGDAMEVDEPS